MVILLLLGPQNETLSRSGPSLTTLTTVIAYSLEEKLTNIELKYIILVLLEQDMYLWFALLAWWSSDGPTPFHGSGNCHKIEYQSWQTNVIRLYNLFCDGSALALCITRRDI